MSAPVLAHHGDAGRYDETPFIITGTVVEIKLTNPHSILVFDATDADGKVVRWQAEMGSGQQLIRQFGWTKENLKIGDKVTLNGRKVKSGAPYMNMTEKAQIVMADTGKEIFRRRPDLRAEAVPPPARCSGCERKSGGGMRGRDALRLSSGGGSFCLGGHLCREPDRHRLRPPRGQLRQVAYLKASNPSEDAHFGCGGTLTGHAGNSSAISARRQHDRVGAPHESSGAKGINGNQNDKSALQLRRGVRLHAPRQRGDPAGLHQGVESRRRRQLRVERRVEPRRQHAGRGRVLRVQQRDRDQRQPGRSLDSRGRRRLRLHAHAAGPGRSRRTSRRRTRATPPSARTSPKATSSATPSRLSADGNTLAVGAIGEDSNATASTATRPTTPRISPARPTSSRGPAAPGRSRPTSSRR